MVQPRWPRFETVKKLHMRVKKNICGRLAKYLWISNESNMHKRARIEIIQLWFKKRTSEELKFWWSYTSLFHRDEVHDILSENGPWEYNFNGWLIFFRSFCSNNSDLLLPDAYGLHTVSHQRKVHKIHCIRGKKTDLDAILHHFTFSQDKEGHGKTTFSGVGLVTRIASIAASYPLAPMLW